MLTCHVNLSLDELLRHFGSLVYEVGSADMAAYLSGIGRTIELYRTDTQGVKARIVDGQDVPPVLPLFSWRPTYQGCVFSPTFPYRINYKLQCSTFCAAPRL